MVKKRLWMLRLSMLVLMSAILSCTSKPDERVPDERVMHFPHAMALSGTNLAVLSSSADQKYHFGRLVVLDTSAIKRALLSDHGKTPIFWSSVVISNNLIRHGTGALYYSPGFVMTASQESGKLLAIGMNNGISKCEDPNQKIDECNHASSLELSSYDPFSIAGLIGKSNEEHVVVSYLGSDQIDIIRREETKGKDALSLRNSFNAMDFVRQKPDAEKVKNQRLITKKIATSAFDGVEKIFFLVELHPKKSTSLARPKGSFLIAIKQNDLLTNKTIAEPNIELWNLSSLASIGGVQDFYVEESKNEAIILARMPESLFKIDLKQKTVIEVPSVCTGVTSMAVDPADDLIVIPCFDDKRLISYSLSSLNLRVTSKVRFRGPTHAVIDSLNKYVYSTFSSEGILAIFDYDLNFLGHVFDKAPINRIGS